MEKKPYHHLPDGTFRNPEGSPKRDNNFKWSFRVFNEKKKNLDMTVPQEHVVEKTKDLKAECLEADIIVAAVGIPELVKGDWVKKDAIVIDVGINKTDKGIVGDVAFDEVSKVAKALTPVPGGVGPMTIACLLKNTVECFKRSQKI